MGVSLSKPEKPRAETLLPAKQRHSVALRQRISLNKMTLDRILKQMGHPVRERLRTSIRQSHRLIASRTAPTPPTERAPRCRQRDTQPESVTRSCTRAADTNKSLPPLPRSAPTSASRLAAELERSYIERHREETLRRLESGREAEAPLQSRVPTIIFNRIKRSGMLWDSPMSPLRR